MQIGAAVGRLDGGQPLAQLAAIIGEFLHDLRRIGETDDHRRHARVHLVDQPVDELLGFFQAVFRVRRVSGRHAGRIVDQENEPLSFQPGALPAGPQQGQHRQGHQQQLQEQEQALSQALPKAVDVQVFDRLLPQIRAGHLQRLAAELEEVQRQNRRRHRREGGPLPAGERVVEEVEHGRGSRVKGRGWEPFGVGLSGAVVTLSVR